MFKKNNPDQDFEVLLRPHLEQMFRVAFRFTGMEDRAEDLVQETLVRLYPRLEEMRDLDKPGPWIMRVMQRIFIDDLRRYRRSPVQLLEDGPRHLEEGELVNPWDQVDGGAESPEEQIQQSEEQDRLSQVWDQLGPDHQVLLTLHDIEGYTLVELAETLDSPIGTLKSRLHRARARFRDLLDMEPSDSPIRVSR